MKPNTELTAVDPIERWVAITGEEPIRELSQVPPAMVAELIAVFAPHAQAVRQLAAMAKGVCVTDENDAAGMAEARRLRLAIRKVRLAAEDDRKEQKAWAVIAGRVVDWLANGNVRDLAVRLETKLEADEKFAERMEEERRQKVAMERFEILRPIADDLTGIDLVGMTDEQFERLRAGFQAAHDAAEAQRVAAEQERQSEAARVAAIEEENARLRAQVEAQAPPACMSPGTNSVVQMMASWNANPVPSDPVDEVVLTVYTDADESVGFKSQNVEVIIPAYLWFSLGAGERDQMTADILNAIGPWMDDKARVRVDAGSDLV